MTEHGQSGVTGDVDDRTVGRGGGKTGRRKKNAEGGMRRKEGYCHVHLLLWLRLGLLCCLSVDVSCANAPGGYDSSEEPHRTR